MCARGTVEESLDANDLAMALEAIQSAIPETPLGVSTGAWIVPDSTLRHEEVARWKVLPDFASVNFKEQGAVELAQLLLCRGVAVEAGLSNVRGVEVLVMSELAPSCLRVLLEPLEQLPEAALRTVQEIEAVLDCAHIAQPRLLHGVNQTAWGLIDKAGARGYDTRIGFEDVLTLPDGKTATNNGVLVAEAARRVRASRA